MVRYKTEGTCCTVPPVCLLTNEHVADEGPTTPSCRINDDHVTITITVPRSVVERNKIDVTLTPHSQRTAPPDQPDGNARAIDPGTPHRPPPRILSVLDGQRVQAPQSIADNAGMTHSKVNRTSVVVPTWTSQPLLILMTMVIMSLTWCILFIQRDPFRGYHLKPSTPVATLWSRKARKLASFMMSGKHTVQYLNIILF